MTRNRMCVTAFAALLLLSPAWAQDDEEEVSFIVDGGKTRHEGTVTKKGTNGDLSFSATNTRVTRAFIKGSYALVHTPKPQVVKEIERLFSAKKYDEAIAKCPEALGKYDWLGWGGRICYLQGKSHLAKGQLAEARAAFSKGQEFGRVDGSLKTLQRAELEILVESGDPAVEGRLKSLSPEPYKYRLLGRLTEKRAGKANNDQNLLTESALHYMKVVLLYSPADGGDDRRESLERLIDVLKLLKDNRHEMFAQRLRQDYP